MSDLFNPSDMPEAPAAPALETVPATASTLKHKRKSYYVPVAKRNAEADKNAAARAHDRKVAKTEAKAAKKAEKALREFKSVANKMNVGKSKSTKPIVKKLLAKEQPKPSKAGGSAICSICHKPLSRHESVAQGMGDTCAAKIAMLPTGTTLADHYEKISVDEIPDGYLKLKDVVEKLKVRGISGYRLMQAIGGERMLRKPINSNFKVVMVAGVRYINGACLQNWKDLVKL